MGVDLQGHLMLWSAMAGFSHACPRSPVRLFVSPWALRTLITRTNRKAQETCLGAGESDHTRHWWPFLDSPVSHYASRSS